MTIPAETLQSDLMIQLLEIPELQSAELGKSKLFVCRNKEIARIRNDGFIDIKLTQPLITALGLVSDETAPGWIQMTVKKGGDVPAVIALVKRAAHASKINRFGHDDEQAS